MRASRPDERRGVKHVGQAIGQPGWIERRHVAHQGHDAGPVKRSTSPAPRHRASPKTSWSLGQGSCDGKSDTPRRSGDQYLPPFAGRFDVFSCHEGQLRSIRLPQRGSGAQSAGPPAAQSRRGPGACRKRKGSLSRPAITNQHSPVVSASRMCCTASTTSLTSRMGKPISRRDCSDPLMMLV